MTNVKFVCQSSGLQGEVKLPNVPNKGDTLRIVPEYESSQEPSDYTVSDVRFYVSAIKQSQQQLKSTHVEEGVTIFLDPLL